MENEEISFKEDLFITSEKGKNITFLHCYITLCDNLTELVLLLVFKP